MLNEKEAMSQPVKATPKCPQCWSVGGNHAWDCPQIKDCKCNACKSQEVK
jgi:hypothetical protein